MYNSDFAKLELLIKTAEAREKEVRLCQEKEGQAESVRRRLIANITLKLIAALLPPEVEEFLSWREEYVKADYAFGMDNVLIMHAPECLPVYVHIKNWPVETELRFIVPPIRLIADAPELTVGQFPRDPEMIRLEEVLQLPAKPEDSECWGQTDDFLLALAEARARFKAIWRKVLED